MLFSFFPGDAIIKLLALETSAKAGSIALAEDGALCGQWDISSGGMQHGRDLLPAIAAAMTATGWKPQELDLVALSQGPGSFTGLRIAVMFARMTAWQTGARIVAVPTLHGIAEAAPPAERQVAVVTDAQRGGVYWAGFTRDADGVLQRTLAEQVGPPEEAARSLPAEAFLLGDGLARYADLLAAWRRGEESLWRPSAARIAALGWAAHLRGEHIAHENLEPLYVRRPAPEEVAERLKRGGR